MEDDDMSQVLEEKLTEIIHNQNHGNEKVIAEAMWASIRDRSNHTIEKSA